MLCNSKTGFPVFDADVHPSSGVLALVGGGGSARSGVSNRVRLGRVIPHASVPGGVQLDDACASAETGLDCLLTVVAVRPGGTSTSTSTSTEVVLVGGTGRELWGFKATAVDDVKGGLGVVFKKDLGVGISALRFASANVLVVGMTNGTLQCFRVDDLAEGSVGFSHVCTLPGHLDTGGDEGGVKDLAVAGPAKPWMASAGSDNRVMIWDMSSSPPSLVGILPADVGMTLRKVRFDGQGSRLFTLQVPRRGQKGNSCLMVWELLSTTASASSSWTLVPHLCKVLSPFLATAMAVSPGGRLVAVSTMDGSITLYDQQTMQKLKSTPKVHSLPVTCLCFPAPQTRGGRPYLVSTSADATMAMIPLTLDDEGTGVLDVLMYCFCLATFVACAVLVAFFVLWLGQVPQDPDQALELIHEHGPRFVEEMHARVASEGAAAWVKANEVFAAVRT